MWNLRKVLFCELEFRQKQMNSFADQDQFGVSYGHHINEIYQIWCVLTQMMQDFKSQATAKAEHVKAYLFEKDYMTDNVFLYIEKIVKMYTRIPCLSSISRYFGPLPFQPQLWDDTFHHVLL
ncbi:unnamed protein product [Moneuplotes crassus]|uniref:Uncharacterized protein n=1 Tax=Euplotes crassus TaxID=5936 RepID=A0AAD1XTQ0_EUPCR|nr:unnamed protein product [Moneuplotes crassus]